MNQINAQVKNQQQEIVCKVKGMWDGLLEYEYVNSEKSSRSINVNDLKSIRKRVKPLDMQESNESRRLWSKVTDCLKNNDISMATQHKIQLEKNQRRLYEPSHSTTTLPSSTAYFNKSIVQYEENFKTLKLYSCDLSEKKIDINASFTTQTQLDSDISEQHQHLNNQNDIYWLNNDWKQ